MWKFRYNEKLYITQLKTISRELGNVRGKLDETRKSLAARRGGKKKSGKKPPVVGTRKKVEAAPSAQHMKKFIEAEVSEEEGLPRLCYGVVPEALSNLSETTLGKKILFADNHEWSTEQIVAAYHAETEVEEAFKRMKRPHTSHPSLRRSIGRTRSSRCTPSAACWPCHCCLFSTGRPTGRASTSASRG